MTDRPIFVGDTIVMEINVVDQAGAPKNLTGATVAARAGFQGVVAVGTASVVSAAAGEVQATFAGNLLAPGTWEVQIRVTQNEETTTMPAGTLLVSPSLFS